MNSNDQFSLQSLPGFTPRKQLLSVAMSLATLSAAPTLQAQSEAEFSLEEVVVTARKRTESLQDVPVAVSAFGGDALEMRNVTSIETVAQFVPNVQFDGAAALSGGSANATIFIRGIGQNDFALFSDPGVGTYVDGVFLGRSMGGVMDVVDIQSLEVLRGPQGTLFGKNTIGGAINITSQKPQKDFGGEIAATIGRFNRTDVKGTLNLPLIDDVLLTRWTLASNQRDGYAERIIDGEELGDKDTVTGRMQALWHVSNNVDVSLITDYTHGRAHSAANTLLSVDTAGLPHFTLFNNYVAPATGIVAPNGQTSINSSWITNNPYKTYGTGPNENDLDSWGISVAVDWSLSEGLNFKSITAARDLEAKFARDGDNTPFTFRESSYDNEQDQFSQEFQFTGNSFDNKFDWLAGIYYFEENAEELSAIRLAAGLYDALEAQPGPVFGPFGGPGAPNFALDLDLSVYNKIETESYAAFGHGSWRFNEELSLTVGARYTHETKDFEIEDKRIPSNTFLIPPGSTWNAEWSEFTPKLGLEYQLTDDAMMYLSYAKGFKSGGFNGRPTNSIADVTEYEPEIVDSYELGLKSSWLDNRLTFNTAVFYMDYQDIQLTINQTPANFVANAAKAIIQGVEMEVIARPLAELDVNFSVGYIDAEYDDVGTGLTANQTLPITEDSKLAKTPRLTLSGGLQYRFNLENHGELVLRTDLSYRSKVYHDIANNELLAQSGFTLVDASVAYTTEDENWTLRLFGTNLTDKRYLQSGNAASSPFGNITEGSFAAPRQWGLSAKRVF